MQRCCESLEGYERRLREAERSAATIEKYLRDAGAFLTFLGGRPPSRALLVAYKERLMRRYAPASVNAMLAGINGYLAFLGREELRLKPLRLQRPAFASAERELSREEYLRLVESAKRAGDARAALLMQTLCGTGIRVSELPYITIESARRGAARVSLKGKHRLVLLPPALRRALLHYASRMGIERGPVFLGRGGKPLHRSQVWRAMRAHAARAGVPPEKIFPHNLRHLFARTFYALSRDIAKLADVLGHSNLGTTQLYLRSSGREHARLLSRLGLVVDSG